jgi:hypothetical protein
MTDVFVLLGPVVLLLALAFHRLVGCQYIADFPDRPSTLVAQWSLNEPGATPSGATAGDRVGDHTGTYIALAEPPQPDPQSAFPTEPLEGVPPGGFACGQDSLVQGAGRSAVRFNGAYVKVFDDDPAIQDQLNPAADFSVTAWVVPESPVSPGDVTFRSVLTSRADNANSKGYMIYMGPDLANPGDPAYYWQVWVGVGEGDLNWQNRLVGPVVDFGGPGNTPVTFLAVTYDAAARILSLYVNPTDDGTPSATLTLARPLAPSQGAPLYIGAGKTDVSDQPLPAPGPQYFFRGLIQEVKIWAIALRGGPSEPDDDDRYSPDLVMTECGRGLFGDE